MAKFKRYISKKNSSATIAAVLAYVYRKEELISQCGRYGEHVINGLVELGLVKKVVSKKDNFYFKTEKSEAFKALDFAKEFLWAYHNAIDRRIQNGKKFILCFDATLPTGQGLVEIEEAIKKNYI
ncbi:MAG: hypothetical protein WC656_01330 [Sulfurimonas sp.]|jgi:hypothetical protein